MSTIKEIARSLNVSTATVSNVIHGHTKKMSPETAERVRRQLEACEYVPNMGARMLARGDSRIISVITNYPSRDDSMALQDPFLSEIVASLEKEIRRQRYYMLLYAAQAAAEINAIAQTWNTLGMLVLGLDAVQSRELVRVAKAPVVFIDGFFDNDDAFNNVGLRDREGGYLLTRHLLEMGHRDILFISDQEKLVGVDEQRLKGHREALAEAGIAWREECCMHISRNTVMRMKDIEGLRRKVGLPYTAFMFASDYYAVEAMQVLRGYGVCVPRDISITGFDDNMLARFCNPRLTTIHQTVWQKGERAVQLLLEVVADPEMPTQNIVMPVKLVKGASVRNIAETAAL